MANPTERLTDGQQFCPLCDVSLVLHSGPGTCHLAAQKEFILLLPFAAILRGER